MQQADVSMPFTGLYRGRLITVHPVDDPNSSEWVAFVDGWPVADRRRGSISTFPSRAQAIGRCRVLIDEEAPARRVFLAKRLVRRVVYGIRRMFRGEGRTEL